MYIWSPPGCQLSFKDIIVCWRQRKGEHGNNFSGFILQQKKMYGMSFECTWNTLFNLKHYLLAGSSMGVPPLLSSNLKFSYDFSSPWKILDNDSNEYIDHPLYFISGKSDWSKARQDKCQEEARWQSQMFKTQKDLL